MLGVAIASLFDSKVKKMWHGEREAFDVLKRKVDPAARYVWFHAASLGEFEQGRPLMEQLRREHPEYKYCSRFFSPFGLRGAENYSGAEHRVLPAARHAPQRHTLPEAREAGNGFLHQVRVLVQLPAHTQTPRHTGLQRVEHIPAGPGVLPLVRPQLCRRAQVHHPLLRTERGEPPAAGLARHHRGDRRGRHALRPRAADKGAVEMPAHCGSIRKRQQRICGRQQLGPRRRRVHTLLQQPRRLETGNCAPTR